MKSMCPISTPSQLFWNAIWYCSHLKAFLHARLGALNSTVVNINDIHYKPQSFMPRAIARYITYTYIQILGQYSQNLFHI